MKRILSMFFLLATYTCSNAQKISPRNLYPGLFEAVQLGNIFPDNKTFVDMKPLYSQSAILADYNAERQKADFKLTDFVAKNFIMPGSTGKPFNSTISLGIRKHIDTLWQVLQRGANAASNSSLLPLKFDYIIPGGRFREIYYWDSYFTMLGLQESHKIKVINNMISNFADLIDRYGFIPNGTRTYYLTRSQPPFFSLMVDLLAKNTGDHVYSTYRPELLAEYKFWMSGADTLSKGHAYRNLVRLSSGELMNRYWDSSGQPREESYKQDMNSMALTRQDSVTYFRNIRAAAESGWDFSTRWFDNNAGLATIHTTDLVAIDLNCLLFHLELSIAKSYHLSGDKKLEKDFRTKALARKRAILKYCWDEREGWFKDYNFKLKRVEKIETLAGAFTLEFGISTLGEARKQADKISNSFLKPGGLVTTNNNSGQQWDSPNGWAPLQYITINGLENYHYNALARTIAKRWISLNQQVFEETGKLVEKYNVIDLNLRAGGGEYPLQDGFGWTNGVLINLMNHYQTKAVPDSKTKAVPDSNMKVVL